MFATPSYLDHASCQYADIPLAFFILSTIALICLHSARSSSERGLLVLAGFMAGCAGWTKNEGLLFILATCIVLLVPALWNRSIMAKRFVPFLAGLVLPLAVIIFFKAAIAPPNDLIGSQRYLDVIGRISDVNRYVTILKTFGVNFWVFGRWSVSPLLPLFAFIGLRGIDRQMLRTYGWVSGIAVLAIVLVGYYLVYLNTPFELYTHLYSSLDRLMLHLWPSCLLLLGLCTKTRTTAEIQIS